MVFIQDIRQHLVSEHDLAIYKNNVKENSRYCYMLAIIETKKFI